MSEAARGSLPRRSQHRISLQLTALVVLALAACTEPAEPGGDDDPPAAEPVYRFGVKFEPPVGRVVHGLGQWEEYNVKYNALLPAAQQPASQLIFITIGDTPRGWQPEIIALQLASHDAQGRIPHIDIALRGLQPGKAVIDTMADPLYGIDDEIANTTKFDSRIDDLVHVVRDYGRPVMVRIGGEFNGWWNGYHPYDYPKAFRKIVQRFRSGGAHNAAFIWCYEPAGPDDFDAGNGAGEYRWFPGDDVVDWFSIDLFAAADISGPLTLPGRGDLSPYGRTLRFLDMAVTHARPVIIAESSPAHYDFSHPASAQAAWNDWFDPYLKLIAAREEILWFHYINYDWTKAGYYAQSGWKNNDLTASPLLSQRWVDELARPHYLHADEKHLLRDFETYR
jgi:hypothetical protein